MYGRETINQETQIHSNHLQTIFDTKYNFQIIPKKLKAGAGYWVDFWHKAEESDNKRNGSLDFALTFTYNFDAKVKKNLPMGT